MLAASATLATPCRYCKEHYRGRCRFFTVIILMPSMPFQECRQDDFILDIALKDAAYHLSTPHWSLSGMPGNLLSRLLAREPLLESRSN